MMLFYSLRRLPLLGSKYTIEERATKWEMSFNVEFLCTIILSVFSTFYIAKLYEVVKLYMHGVAHVHTKYLGVIAPALISNYHSHNISEKLL